MADARTLAVYRDRLDDYVRLVAGAGAPTELARFMAALPPGGRVLDLGCGPGHDAAAMRAAGFAVAAWDASPEMAATARTRFAVEVRVAEFDDLDAEAAYDGIWASFSLSHLPKAAMPATLTRIRRALVPGGRFALGLKTGTGEARDALGRFYAFYTRPEIETLLADAGFALGQVGTGQDVGLAGGAPAPWIVLHADG